MIGLLHAFATMGYAAASIFLGAAFRGRYNGARKGLAAAAGGAILHLCALVLYTRRYGELPLVGFAPSASTLAFVIIAFVLLGAAVSDARSLSLLVTPIVALLTLVALLLGLHPTGAALAFGGTWFILHVLLAFAGYAGLTVASAAGLLYLLQFRELKGKHLGRVFRFVPSLPTLDRLGRAALFVGFPALTLALLVGWGWSVRFRQAWTLEEAQVIWGGISWIVFAVIAAARAPWIAAPERRGALFSVIGFVVVVVTYVVLRVSPAARGGFL